MRLGIDLDGVVADFVTGWTTLYNAEYAATIDPRDVDHWDAIPDLTHFAHMGDFWRWASHLDGGSLFSHLEPYAGAVDALRGLATRHSIVIVTTKPGWAIHDTFAWISKHRIPTREVHITEDKWMVDCDVYLDDGPHVLDDLVAHRPESVVCRYVRPWNEPVHGTIDVASWNEFIEVVHGLDREVLR